MTLEFAFEYQSENGVLERVLARVLSDSGLSGRLSRVGYDTRLFVESDATEKLEAFATELSREVPHSIFLKEYRVEAIERMPALPPWRKPAVRPEAVPPCPRCLETLQREGNIFVGCEVCGYPVEPGPVLLRAGGKEKRFEPLADHRPALARIAAIVDRGGSATIRTMNGLRTVAALSRENFERFEPEWILVPDPHTASRYFTMQKGEVLAVGSIEKPLLRLARSEQFESDFAFAEQKLLRVGMADDAVLALLVSELGRRREHPICYLSETIDPESIAELSFEAPPASWRRMEATVTVEGEAVLTRGDREILPYYRNDFSGSRGSACGSYVGWIDARGIHLDRKERSDKIPAPQKLILPPNESSPWGEEGASAAAAPHRHGAFFSVLQEHGLLEQASAAIYLSREHESAIMTHSKKYGLLDLIGFEMEYRRFDEIFLAIEGMNESGPSLLANYRKKFPLTMEWLQEQEIDPVGSGIFRLFGIIGMVLEYGREPREAVEKLLTNAAAFKGEKGPRIDYKLREKKRSLDPLWALRTAMSFRLAGVDEETLSFGVVESFSEFLSNTVDDLSQDMGFESVVLCGSLFGEKKILQKTHQMIAKNHPLYLGRSLPLDELSVAHGLLFLRL